jgi:hypothetical protein
MARQKQTEIKEAKKARKKELLARLNQARQDRAHHQDQLNRFYELALPTRQPIQHNVMDMTPRAFEDQSDIFDDTLLSSTMDFAAEMMDRFTPNYKPWAELKPTKVLPNNIQAKLKPILKERQELLQATIKASDFYEQCSQVWQETAGSKGGMIIPFAPAGKKIRCTPIVMSGLLDDTGPEGALDMRAHEFITKKKHLKHLYPNLQAEMEKDLKLARKKPDANCNVIQGCHENETRTGWIFFVMIDGEVISDKKLPNTGGAPIHVLRWSDAPYSSWGPGPAMQAMPSAEVLQEMGYLLLKHLGKTVDPPFTYTEDGLFNPEGGIDSGMALPRGYQSELEWLIPDRDINAALWERDNHRDAVKKAMFQDQPEQAGKTPPTATQWIDERAQMDRRLQLNRLRIYKEWVLPVLERFNGILEMRGELEPIQLDGEIIDVSFENPITKASDAEEVSRSMQLAQSMVGIAAEPFLAVLDAEAYFANLKEKMGDNLLVFKPFEQQSDQMQQLLGGMRNLSNNG